MITFTKRNIHFPFFIFDGIPEFVMLVGLPGSGKSYFCNQFYKNYAVVSSDSARSILYSDSSIQGDPKEVFDYLHSKITEFIKSGKSCVLDATNINSKKRIQFLNSISNLRVRKKVTVLGTPYEVCLQNNIERQQDVPESIIHRMYKSFDMPFYGEGWDEINIYYPRKEYKKLYGNIDSFISQSSGYNQRNSNHVLTLGEHCKKCGDLLEGSPVEVVEAGYLHDNGKPFCQSFKDGDTNAHYYNHENVGCYNSLFYDSSNEKKKIERAILIRYHMLALEEKSLEKRRKLFGQEMIDKLYQLSQADKNAT